MPSKYRVAIIGCGKARGSAGATGYGMSHQHMFGWAKTGKCELAAVADISKENAEAFVKDHNPKAAVYSDYKEMMAKEKPDFVSVALWPHLHAQVVLGCVPFKPKAIHCEKPMDIHWDDCVKMHGDCVKAGIQLTFNHQRRFNTPFVKAKKILDEGGIGKVQRIESSWHNLADSGTHWLDMLFYFNHETPVDWVLAQIEARGSKKVFGAWNEGQSICTWQAKNGVRFTYHGGFEYKGLGCMFRVFGSEGILEIFENGPKYLRVHRYDKQGWEEPDPGEGIHGDNAIHAGIADLVDSLEVKRRPQLSSYNAIQATEITFAVYESSKRRGRVDLPLAPGRSALLSMFESGDMKAPEETKK